MTTLSREFGVVMNRDAVLGEDSTGNGTVTVSNIYSYGSGGLWNIDGTITIGAGGKGTLTVKEHGIVQSRDTVLGRDNGSAGTVNLSGDGRWEISGPLTIGSGGNGTLTLKDRSYIRNNQFENSPVYLGRENTGVGNVTVSGSNGTSRWENNGNLVIGGAGQGALTIKENGYVTNRDTVLGEDSTGNGIATVSGNGDNAHWHIDGNLTVGANGKGTLTIKERGVMYSRGTVLGAEFGGNGTVTVSGSYYGDAHWEIDGALTVGAGGKGALTVGEFGRVQNRDAVLGRDNGSGGTVNISGGEWRTERLTVGAAGSGTLTVGGGGEVWTDRLVTLGGETTGQGVLNLAGGQVRAAGFQKGGGAGTLNFNGGKIIAAADNDNFFRDLGTLNLSNAGLAADAAALTLEVGDGLTVSVANDFSFTNTPSKTRAGNAPVALEKAGGGTLLLSGTLGLGAGAVSVSGGTLVLAADNDYHGGTAVAGTLRVTAARALGDGGLRVSAGGELDLFGVGVLGTLNLSGDAELLGTLRVTLGAGGLSDQILGNGGNLTVSGVMALDNLGGIDYSQTYQLFANFAPLLDQGLTVSGYDTANWQAMLDTTGLLYFAAVPETSTWALMVSGLLAAWAVIGRRGKLRMP